MSDLAIVLITAIASVLASVALIFLSSRIRNRERWESYGQNLWDEKIKSVKTNLTVGFFAHSHAVYCFDIFESDSEEQKKRAAALSDGLNNLALAKPLRLLFCTPNFNQAVEELTGQLLVIRDQFERGALVQKLAGNLPRLWFQLVDDARTEIGSKALDAKVREALSNAESAAPFNPSGNDTLTY